MTVSFSPIATIRCDYRDTSEIPKGPGAEHHAEGIIDVREDLAEGLADIEGFSHLYVVWVFDRQKEVRLTVTPPNDDRPHGVLATRAPVRPNPIGLTMLDGTPVLDIKPYLSNVPAERLKRGWLDAAEARRAAPPAASQEPGA
jgi:tRNA (adenine37-N6)-methyltransferase